MRVHKKNAEKFREFGKLYKLGVYSLSKVARMVDISESTAEYWAKHTGKRVQPKIPSASSRCAVPQLEDLRKTMQQKRKDFERFYLTGKYTQKQCAQMVGISGKTACHWVAEIPSLQYLQVRKDLLKRLGELSKLRDYESNKDTISVLLEQVGQVEALIRKAKYSNV